MVVGGDGEMMAGRVRSRLVMEKLWLAVGGCGWLWVVVAKLWLFVDGRGFFITYFYCESKNLHSFLNSICATRGRTFISKGKRIQ